MVAVFVAEPESVGVEVTVGVLVSWIVVVVVGVPSVSVVEVGTGVTTCSGVAVMAGSGVLVGKSGTSPIKPMTSSMGRWK